MNKFLPCTMLLLALSGVSAPAAAGLLTRADVLH